ncbi:DUF4153 domain-containing protein [Tropicibacter sp. R15_0]|uniref:DUF4153 domain-containing protein n=1 Tax=Tropicibacter sp. R15_0 TaxID=2821101 RepID=UPI001ADB9A3F|nr:DUF4153 domain-containing protein [Tropicibacter sp. R15_0]MBO9468309.1 DUF4153 domain-containing protein [Tropicibacter sp. R15_0]
MSAVTTAPPLEFRLSLPVLGAGIGAAGWCLWWLWQNALVSEHALLAFAAGLSAWAIWLASALGTGRVGPILVGATSAAALLAGALWWAASRHIDVASFLSLGYPIIAWGMITAILTPLLAAEAEQAGGWSQYRVLFRSCWQVLQRHALALLICGFLVFFLTLMGSVLRLSGLSVATITLAGSPAFWVILGAIYGASLALARNMDSDVSPFLMVELLRFFLPLVALLGLGAAVMGPVTMWVGTGTVALNAQLLAGLAVAAIVTIAAALGADRMSEVQDSWLRICVVVLALILPLLTGLLAWSVGLRVAQYGWTPTRLMAATGAAILLIYGVTYGLSLLLRGDWMARIREVNLGLALASLVVAFIWLTPLVVPERIASMSQAMRALRGEAGINLPLRELARDWGKPGQRVLEQIAQLRPDLRHAIGLARPEVKGGPDRPIVDRARLARVMPVLPDQDLADEIWEALPEDEARLWLRACEYKLDGFPGCALILGPRVDGTASGLVLLRDLGGSVLAKAISLENNRLQVEGEVILPQGKVGAQLTLLDLVAVQSGAVSISEQSQQVFRLNGRAIFVHN